MDLRSEIVAAIKIGMRNACTDMHYFTAQPQLCFNAEYLFTVNTAKAINDHNYVPGHRFEIRIEQGTQKFARDCLPLIKRGNPMIRGSSVFRGKINPKIERTGRVDIAVYHDPINRATFGSIPLCAIEVKGFNPARILVLKDLRRNLEFMRLNGPSGPSQIEFTSFAALHDASQATDLEAIEYSLGDIRRKYSKWLSELGALTEVITEIETFTVSSDSQGTISEEVGEAVIDLSTRHHFVGVIVNFVRQKLHS